LISRYRIYHSYNNSQDSTDSYAINFSVEISVEMHFSCRRVWLLLTKFLLKISRWHFSALCVTHKGNCYGVLSIRFKRISSVDISAEKVFVA